MVLSTKLFILYQEKILLECEKYSKLSSIKSSLIKRNSQCGAVSKEWRKDITPEKKQLKTRKFILKRVRKKKSNLNILNPN